jgi:hypothetical protein
MMNRVVLPLLLAAGCHAAGDVQRVEGFERVIFAHNNHPSATVQSARAS